MVYMLSKTKNCSKHETVCPICQGTTIGDYGQPFECETCMGTGTIPLFEMLEKQ
jgi:DnaJ-class molecular chaperone